MQDVMYKNIAIGAKIVRAFCTAVSARRAHSLSRWSNCRIAASFLENPGTAMALIALIRRIDQRHHRLVRFDRE